MTLEVVTITCPACRLEKSVPQDASPPQKTNVTCPRCRYVFVFDNEPASLLAAPEPLAPPRKVPAPQDIPNPPPPAQKPLPAGAADVPVPPQAPAARPSRHQAPLPSPGTPPVGFFSQAAKASVVIPLIVLGAATLGRSAIQGIGPLIVGGILVALLAAGIILGIVGICGRKKGDLIPSVAGILLNGIFLYVLLTLAATAFTPEKKLAVLSERLNKTLPREIEPGIRLEKTIVGPEKTLTYPYSVAKKSSEVNSEKLKESLVPNITKGACEDKTMRELLDKGVTARFSYTGSDGITIAEINVSSADCSAK